MDIFPFHRDLRKNGKGHIKLGLAIPAETSHLLTFVGLLDFPRGRCLGRSRKVPCASVVMAYVVMAWYMGNKVPCASVVMAYAVMAWYTGNKFLVPM